MDVLDEREMQSCSWFAIVVPNSPPRDINREENQRGESFFGKQSKPNHCVFLMIFEPQDNLCSTERRLGNHRMPLR